MGLMLLLEEELALHHARTQQGDGHMQPRKSLHEQLALLVPGLGLPASRIVGNVFMAEDPRSMVLFL